MFMLFPFCIHASSDIEGPVINGCPSNQSGVTDSGIATGTISWTAPSATDNSGTQTLTSTHNPGDSFPIGTTIVTYMSTDAAGNTATCSFDVVVNGEFIGGMIQVLYSQSPKISLSLPLSSCIPANCPYLIGTVPIFTIKKGGGGVGRSNFTLCPYFYTNLSVVMYRKSRNVPVFKGFPPICHYFLDCRVGRSEVGIGVTISLTIYHYSVHVQALKIWYEAMVPELMLIAYFVTIN